MSRKSIYKEFSQKLIFATSFFVVVLSLIFYGFTKATIYEDISDELLKDAKLIVTLSKSQNDIHNSNYVFLVNDDTTIEVVEIQKYQRLHLKIYKKIMIILLNLFIH